LLQLKHVRVGQFVGQVVLVAVSQIDSEGWIHEERKLIEAN
jgi:hypothetical protein